MNMKQMMEKAIKKLLRKWLKKKLYSRISLDVCATRFEWVYNAPLREWRDRIWVVKHCGGWAQTYDKHLEYIRG